MHRRRTVASIAAVLCLAGCAGSAIGAGPGGHGAGSRRDQPVSQAGDASCARADDQRNRLVGAELRLHTVQEPKEPGTMLQLLLVVGGRSVAGVRTGAGHRWPDDATVGPLPVQLLASAPGASAGSAPNRADVVSTGRVELSSSDVTGGRSAGPGTPPDDWHLGWRLRLRWSDGSTDVLAAPTAAPAARGAYVRLLAGQDGSRFEACAAVVPAQRWDVDDWFAGVGPARVLFFDRPGFHGLRLVRRAESFGSDLDTPLGEIGRHCGVNHGADDPVVGCSDTWDDVTTSISTTGAGQRAAVALVSDDPDWRSCLLVPAYRRIPDLGRIVVRDPDGVERTTSWAGRISMVRVSPEEPSGAGCERFVRNAG